MLRPLAAERTDPRECESRCALTWAVHTRGGLREFFPKEGTHWVEQNRAKNSRWAKLAREGHDIAWEVREPRARRLYCGRVLIDGEILTAKDAYKRFFR